LWWNCGGGIKNKIEYIKYTLSTLNPIALFISEAEIGKFDDLGVITVENYDLLTSKNLEFGKSRSAVYVRSEIKYKRLERSEKDSAEIVSLLIDGNVLLGIYRPFKPTVEGESLVENFDRLVNALKKVEIDCNNIYIGGDFNVDWRADSTMKEKLVELSVELNLCQLINEITRTRLVRMDSGFRLEESSLDHIFSNDCQADTKVIQGQPSDHHMLQLTIPEIRPPEKKKTLIRDWRAYSKEDLLTNIRLVKENYNDWIEKGPFTLLDRIIIILLTIYDEMVPLRVAKVTNESTINAKIEALRKRRDRFLKKFKKTENPEHAIKARTFSNTLKKVIKKENRRTIKVKSTSGNPKCFWSMINRLQGKFKKKIPGLTINDQFTEDPNLISEAFADGFLKKISTLSEHQNPIAEVEDNEARMEDFTITELENTIIKIKSKKSCGLDSLPTCVMKDAFSELKDYYLRIFNGILSDGLPASWKIAVITPLHKKGATDDVGNFRPISNLSSLGKFFEKCVLNRLNTYEELVGENQHGFRKGYSTVSAMLEIQSHLATSLDQGLLTCIYSVDMSAAFDLLRVDTFNELLKDTLDPGLMWTLIDFLKDRKFIVRHENVDSQIRNLDRGCVQGSVLGPALFSAYCKNLTTILSDTTVTSYADDTYVIINASTVDDLVYKTTSTMSKHFDYLSSLGMVVNKSKTELMFMRNRNKILPGSITVDLEEIKAQNSIKILGIQFDHDLGWNTHIGLLNEKARKMINGLKVIRRSLNQDDTMKVITSQFYGRLFYGISVWHPALTVKQQKKMDILHYKALRVAVKDYMRIFPREMLDLLGRQKPHVIAQYMTGSFLINCYNSRVPSRLFAMIKTNEYVIRRSGKIRFYDSSKKRIGSQAIFNRLDTIVQRFDDNWTKLKKKDCIRIYLKKIFFK